VSGFRCPYLSYNEDTIDVLRRGGFAWTSNNMILWANGFMGDRGHRERAILRKISNLYHIDHASSHPALPRLRDLHLDIPITGPDDEMLRERCKIRKRARITEVCSNILRQTYERASFSTSSSIPRGSHTSGSVSRRSSAA
jgi:hypothetical protein